MQFLTSWGRSCPITWNACYAAVLESLLTVAADGESKFGSSAAKALRRCSAALPLDVLAASRSAIQTVPGGSRAAMRKLWLPHSIMTSCPCDSRAISSSRLASAAIVNSCSIVQHPCRGGAARLCALAGAPSAAKAVLDTLLALPGAQGKKGAVGGGAHLEVNSRGRQGVRSPSALQQGSCTLHSECQIGRERALQADAAALRLRCLIQCAVGGPSLMLSNLH